MAHANKEVNCSFCNDEHVLWNQFECLVCLDYNLCSKCHEKQRYNRQHRPYHPMQLVMSQLDYFKFRNSVVQPNIGLSCPFCGNIKSNIDEFLQHCFVRHDQDLYNVRCPICVSFCIPECQNIVSPAISFKKHLEKCHEVRQKVSICTTCTKYNFQGNRYVCLLCPEYEQCVDCYTSKRQNQDHKPYHPMQKILPKKAYAVQNPPPARIYRCPFCGEDDFSVGGLANHCFKLHVDCKMSSIRCPICVVCRLQIEDDSLPKGSFFDHLMMVHGLFPKDRQQEPEEPTECTVCKLELDGEAAAKKYYQCSHDCFHDRCIRFWLSSNPICPICHADAA